MTEWNRAHWAAPDTAALSAYLLSLSDADYLAFHSRLVTTAAPLNGVRLPQIKALSKQIAKGNWREFLECFHPVTYEEIMLRGLVIGLAKGDLEEILAYTAEFVPLIDNWAVNDSFASALKITASHREAVWAFLEPYLSSNLEFPLRFGVTMLMDYYLTEEYINRVLEIYSQIDQEGYYVKMAVAWALSVCYVKFPAKTMELLRENHLDDFTYNKAIQKMLESYRVPDADKRLLRSMKRNSKAQAEK